MLSNQQEKLCSGMTIPVEDDLKSQLCSILSRPPTVHDSMVSSIHLVQITDGVRCIFRYTNIGDDTVMLSILMEKSNPEK